MYVLLISHHRWKHLKWQFSISAGFQISKGLFFSWVRPGSAWQSITDVVWFEKKLKFIILEHLKKKDIYGGGSVCVWGWNSLDVCTDFYIFSYQTVIKFIDLVYDQIKLFKFIEMTRGALVLELCSSTAF